MSKSKTVVSVYVDVSRLVWETRSLNSTEDWGIWAKNFVESLATNNLEISSYGAFLIRGVHDFRNKEAQRLRNLRENKENVQVQSVQSVQEPVQTERKKERKNLTLKPTAKRNELFDAVANSFFPGATLSKQDGSRIGKQVSILKEKNSSPEMVAIKKAAYQKIHPTWECTLEAVVKHWDSLVDSTPPKSDAWMRGVAERKAEEDRYYSELMAQPEGDGSMC